MCFSYVNIDVYLSESDREVSIRYEVYYKCLSYSWRNIVDVYLPTLTYLPTYIAMRGKGYMVMMMIMIMTTKLAPIAGICFFL